MFSQGCQPSSWDYLYSIAQYCKSLWSACLPDGHRIYCKQYLIYIMHSYFCILLLDTYILSHICAALSETESIGYNSRTQTDLSALSLLRSCSGIFLKATSEDIISVASSGESCESGTRVWRGACRQSDTAACWCPINECPAWWPECGVARANNGM